MLFTPKPAIRQCWKVDLDTNAVKMALEDTNTTNKQITLYPSVCIALMNYYWRFFSRYAEIAGAVINAALAANSKPDKRT